MRDQITTHHVRLLLPPPLMSSSSSWLFPLTFPFPLVDFLIYLLLSLVPTDAKTPWASLLGNKLSAGKCLQIKKHTPEKKQKPHTTRKDVGVDAKHRRLADKELSQWFSNFIVHENHLEGFVK